MAKQRKTRAQKVATAEKRTQLTYSFTPVSPVTTSVEKVAAPAYKPSMTTVMHVKHDLFKTVFTSLFLIAAQIILLLLLQHHVIKIPGATY